MDAQNTHPICKSCPVYEFAIANPDSSPMCPMLNQPESSLGIPLEERWEDSDDCQRFTCDARRVAIAIQGALNNPNNILNINIKGECIRVVSYGSLNKPIHLGRFAEVEGNYRLFLTNKKTGEILQQANYISQEIKKIIQECKPQVLRRYQQVFLEN